MHRDHITGGGIMNEIFEKYISELPEEYREGANKCKSIEELNDYIADNDLELPEDALELVSGGVGSCFENGNTEVTDAVCPDCKTKLTGVPAGGALGGNNNESKWCPSCHKIVTI